MKIQKLAGLGGTVALGAACLAGPTASAAPLSAEAESRATTTTATTLCMYELYVSETEDWGTDEAYIKDDGTAVWGPRDVNNGDNKWVGVRFTSGSNISLYDQDGGHGGDDDDWLGSHRISGTGYYWFTGDGARYRLSVHSSQYC